MAGERVRHNTTQLPVNTALEDIAWFFIGLEAIAVLLVYLHGWWWMWYTAWVLFALIILDWALIVFINWRLGKIKAYQSELKGYQEEQSRGALVRDFVPDAADSESARQFNRLKYVEPLAGAEWPDVNDFTDTSEFRVIKPLSNTGEEHDVRADANQVGLSGAGSDTSSSPGPTGQAGADGGAFGRSWGAGGWSHASGDGGHRTTDDGPSTRIDLHQRDKAYGEDEPTVVFDASGVTITPGGGIRESHRRNKADQDAGAAEWEGLKDYPS